MLLHPTIESLKALRLFGMVRALEEQLLIPSENCPVFRGKLPTRS